jgi:hypothetical protein
MEISSPEAGAAKLPPVADSVIDTTRDSFTIQPLLSSTPGISRDEIFHEIEFNHQTSFGSSLPG